MSGATAWGGSERGDFWLDATLRFHLTDDPQAELSRRPDPALAADYAYKTTGDSSVVATFNGACTRRLLLLTPGPFLPNWTLGPDWVFRCNLAHAGKTDPSAISLTMIDVAGNLARGSAAIRPSSAGWQLVETDLAQLERPADFDFKRVTRLALGFAGVLPERVWLDAVRFVGPGGEIALTDQLTTQRMAEEIETRKARIDDLFQALASPTAGQTKPCSSYYPVPAPDHKTDQPDLERLFANLMLNRDLEQTNRDLLGIYGSTDRRLRAHYGLEYTWHLNATPMLYRLYLNFGSKSTRYPGRLSPEVEKVILDLLWERTKHKNDIKVASESTWNLTGSENHDVNAKVSNVISSMIFMREPEFADRVYPNLGSGFGSGYWFHITEKEGRYHGLEGTAPRNYPGDYLPRDHYAAWVGFMKTYLRERAQRGFFLEKASPGYMRYTVGFLQDLHDYVDDAELKTLSGMFLDLVWAEWAQDQLAGGRGGAKTRDHGPQLDLSRDAMYDMATFIFGGPSRYNLPLTSFWLTEYRPPAVVWNLVLNREALGSFAYLSRTPGEEMGAAPRPAGYERTLMTDTDSRLLRYSWVTPDYILGTQMDHPLAVHSHLSPAGRAQGMTFATAPDAMVFPRDIRVQADGSQKIGSAAMYRSMQQGPVLITQQNRNFLAVSPEWFPNVAHESQPFGVYFSKNLAQVEEQEGWVFVEEGNAYLAVRVVQGEYQVSVEAGSGSLDWQDYQASAEPTEPLVRQPYSWNSDRTLLRCEDRHSPIIFEAGRRADFPTLEDFKRHILNNPLVLNKTTVPGWYTLSYTSNGVNYYFNAANSEVPRINGRPIDYAPTLTFDSPYLRAVYRSGVVSFRDGQTQIVLDFARAHRTQNTLP